MAKKKRPVTRKKSVDCGWVKDPEMEERILKELNLKPDAIWFFHLEDVDWAETNKNPGRLERTLDKPLILEYAEAMKMGDKFPRVVACGSEEKPVILGGVTRCHAAKIANRSPVVAYGFHNLDEIQKIDLAMVTNVTGGKRPTLESKMSVAIYCHTHFKVPLKNLARKYRINLSTLASKVRANRLKERCVSLGFSERLHEGAYARLHPLKGNKKVLLAGAQHIADHKLILTEVDEFIQSVVSTEDEDDRLDIIEGANETKERETRLKAELRSDVTRSVPSFEKVCKSIRSCTTTTAQYKTWKDLHVRKNSKAHHELATLSQILVKQLQRYTP